MEKEDNLIELEELRDKMKLLDEKLEHQTIINDELIRDSIRHKIAWIASFVKFGAFLAFVGIPLMFWRFAQLNICLAPLIYFSIGAVACTLMDIKLYILDINKHLNDSLQATAIFFAQRKKKIIITEGFEFIFTLIFVFWFGYETKDFLLGGLKLYCIIMGSGLLVISFIIYRIIKTHNETSEYIKKITEGKE